MSFPRSVKDLCPPALFYFSISIIGLLLIAFQNFSNEHVYALGNYSCAVTSTTNFNGIQIGLRIVLDMGFEPNVQRWTFGHFLVACFVPVHFDVCDYWGVHD